MPHRHNIRLTRNNFDLLRLLFAATVCLVHAHTLSEFQSLRPIATILSSSVAVKAFFVVSGFLIFMSYERSSSLRSYAQKRVRRIYPAYFTVVMLCALGMVAVSSKGAADYFTGTWWRYVAANLMFLNFVQPTLPGVFESNNLAAVNGALWTLKIEAMFYVSVPLFVFLIRRTKALPVLALAYLASTIYALLLNRMAQASGSNMYAELARQLPGQLSYFMAGAFLLFPAVIREIRRLFSRDRYCDTRGRPVAAFAAARTIRAGERGRFLRAFPLRRQCGQVWRFFLRSLHSPFSDHSIIVAAWIVRGSAVVVSRRGRRMHRHRRGADVAPGRKTLPAAW